MFGQKGLTDYFSAFVLGIFICGVIKIGHAQSRIQLLYEGIGNCHATGFVTTIDGGYVIVGKADTTNTPSTVDDRAMIMKIDSSGVVQWSRTYFDYESEFTAVERHPSGGFAVAGLADTSFAPLGIFCIVDTIGNLVTSRFLSKEGYIGGPFHSMTPMTDSTYTLVGISRHSLLNPIAYQVDQNGDLRWGNLYDIGGPNYLAREIIRTSSGDLLLVGYTRLSRNGGSIVKLSSGGLVKWSRIYEVGGYALNTFFDTKEANGGYVSIGEVNVGGSPNGNITLSKVDTSGVLLWHKEYGTSRDERGRNVIAAQDGGYYLLGHGVMPAGDKDVLLFRTDSVGSMTWVRSYGAYGDEMVIGTSRCLSMNTAGDISFVATSFDSLSGKARIVLIETDPSGFPNDPCILSSPTITEYDTTLITHFPPQPALALDDSNTVSPPSNVISIDTLSPCCEVSAGIQLSGCDSIIWQGIGYYSSGAYQYLKTDSNGCDTLFSVNVLIYPSFSSGFFDTTCASYFWNGQVYTNSGSYVQTLTDVNGCDSVVTAHLIVHEPAATSFSDTACTSYIWNGQVYTNSGSYVQTLTDVNGCDSVVTAHLIVHEPAATSFSDTACTSYIWNGQVYTNSGSYVQTLTDVNGCDSVVTAHLIVHEPAATSFSDTACTSYIWNGQVYTNSGSYIQTLTDVNGCDSVVTAHLIVHEPAATSFSDTACTSYIWNGQVYTNSGSYIQTLTDVNGCDSLVTLFLQIDTLNIGVSNSGSTLYAAQTNAIYQWIDCNLSNSPIPGAISQSYSVPFSGSFAVIVDFRSCVDTSSCIPIMILANDIEGLQNGPTYYPNPTEELLTIVLPSPSQYTTVEVADLRGKVFLREHLTGKHEHTLDVSGLSSGVYLLLISYDGVRFSGRFAKQN